MKRLTLLIFFLLLPALSLELSSVSIDASFNPDLSLTQSVSFQFSSHTPISTLSYTIPTDSVVEKVTMDSIETDYSFKEGSLSIFFTERKEGKIEITFSSTAFSEADGNALTFFTDYKAPSNLPFFSLTLEIPEDYSLYAPEGPELIPSAIISSSSGRTTITWQTSLEKGERYYIYASFVKEQQPFTLYILALLLAVAAFLAGTKLSSKPGRVRIVTQNPDHTRILQIVKASPGLTHKDVAKKTGFSKAKVSRLVRTLVSGGLIYQKGRGRSKKLNLSRKDELVSQSETVSGSKDK